MRLLSSCIKFLKISSAFWTVQAKIISVCITISGAVISSVSDYVPFGIAISFIGATAFAFARCVDMVCERTHHVSPNPAPIIRRRQE